MIPLLIITQLTPYLTQQVSKKYAVTPVSKLLLASSPAVPMLPLEKPATVITRQSQGKVLEVERVVGSVGWYLAGPRGGGR